MLIQNLYFVEAFVVLRKNTNLAAKAMALFILAKNVISKRGNFTPEDFAINENNKKLHEKIDETDIRASKRAWHIYDIALTIARTICNLFIQIDAQHTKRSATRRYRCKE